MLPTSERTKIKRRLNYYLKTDKKFARVFRETKKIFNASSLTAHNWEHIYRDVCNAIYIGEAEKADMRIVLPAITMHDIGFLYGATGKTHGLIGAQKLTDFLRKINVAFDQATREHIAACIRTHKGSSHKEKPETREAKVVADADFQDKFGPIGVYQKIRTFTEFNWPLEKIIQHGLRNRTLYFETKAGARLGKKGAKFVHNFFKHLNRANRSYQ